MHSDLFDGNSAFVSSRLTSGTLSSRRALIAGVGAAGLAAALGMPARVPGAAGSTLSLPNGDTAAFQLDGAPSAWQARHDQSGTDLGRTFEDLGSQFYRPIDICGYAGTGDVRFASTWELRDGGPAWLGFFGQSADDYQTTFENSTRDGFIPTVVSGYNDGGNARFASIFELRPRGAFQAFHNITGDDMQRIFDDLSPQGYAPTDLSAFVVGDQVRYTAIWEQGIPGAWEIRHIMNFPDFQSANARNGNEGREPVRMSGFTIPGLGLHFAGIWREQPGIDVQFAYNITADQYQRSFENTGGQGYRLVRVSGFPAGSSNEFTTIWHKP